MKIKLLTLIFAATLLLPVLCACASVSDGGTDSPADTSKSELDGTSEETETDAETDTAAVTESDTESESVSTKDDLGNAFVYCALGDSIAYGYGLIDFDNERYSALIGNELTDKVKNFVSFNYAVNGDTSLDLINLIKSGGAPELKHADLVTISIGANNVLGTSLSKLSEYYLYVSSVTDENLKNIRIPQIYDEMMVQNAAGIAQFSLDIITIIEAVRKEAPDAQIVFQTIYNPYRRLDVSFDFIKATLDLAEETDRLVKELNDIIIANSSVLGYDVADVYTAFSGLDNVVNADTFTGGDADFATALVEADPHPNKDGHRIIADTILPLIKFN